MKLIKNVSARLHKSELNAKYILAGKNWCIAFMKKKGDSDE